jgi:flagellar capping protein FliD
MAHAPNREEIDLRLSNAELRYESRFDRIERSLDEVKARLNTIETQHFDLKRTVILTGISGVLAVAGLNYALSSSLVSSFQAGQGTAQFQLDVRKQLDSIQKDNAGKQADIQKQLDELKLQQADAQRQQEHMQQQIDEIALLLKGKATASPMQPKKTGQQSR